MKINFPQIKHEKYIGLCYNNSIEICHLVKIHATAQYFLQAILYKETKLYTAFSSKDYYCMGPQELFLEIVLTGLKRRK